MKQIETEIEIQATPEKLWSILTDFQGHSRWNPFITSMRGNPSIGETLTVFIKPPGGNGMTFKPKVLIFQPRKEFRWKGKLGIRGIFDGEHYFKLVAGETGNTKFIQGEIFSGILVPMMGKALERTKEGFEQMNQALKAECEKVSGPG